MNMMAILVTMKGCIQEALKQLWSLVELTHLVQMNGRSQRCDSSNWELCFNYWPFYNVEQLSSIQKLGKLGMLKQQETNIKTNFQHQCSAIYLCPMTLRRQRQENCQQFKPSLFYIASSKPATATYQYFVSKTNNKCPPLTSISFS